MKNLVQKDKQFRIDVKKFKRKRLNFKMSIKPYQLLKFNNELLYTKDNTKILNNPILNVVKFVVSTYRWTKHSLVTLLANHIIYYPSPINLTYAWSFGSAAGICLVIQILSGIFLAMHYTPHIDLAFSSVERIMRDVNHGWFIRYVHANGASMFFLVVYCHICRGLYYGSYMAPRQLLCASGVVIFLLMMATAFIGYVLPWGQMSFWKATVITNMATAITVVGEPIVRWLWGGYTINNATLNRFFSLHFFLPFVIVGLTVIHLTLLHKDGSNNLLGGDKVPFYPYFFVKDLFAFFCLLFIFGGLVYHSPNTLGHPVNYIPADPIHTPAHIVPQWCLTCDAPENWDSHFPENDDKFFLDLELLVYFLIIFGLGSIIGWKFLWAIIKSPGSLKRELTNRYIIFIVTVMNHEVVPKKFTIFTISLGLFIARNVVRFWPVSYPSSMWCFLIFPFAVYLILFTVLFGYFVLCEKYPLLFGKYLIEFWEKNASPEILAIIGLKSSIKGTKKVTTKKSHQKREYSTTKKLLVEVEPLFATLAILKSLNIPESERQALLEVGQALDSARGISTKEGVRILDHCVLDNEACCRYIAELAKDSNFRNLAGEATIKIKSSFDVSFRYKGPSSTETLQDSVARKSSEIGDSPSKKGAKSGFHGSLDFKIQASQEKELSPQKLKATLLKNSKSLGAVAVPAIGFALGLNALGFPNAEMLADAQKNFALLEETASFDYEESLETRITKSEK